MVNNKQISDLGELILKAISGDASQQEIEHLAEIILNDPQAMEYYKDYTSLYACLFIPGSSFDAFYEPHELFSSSNVSLRGVAVDELISDFNLNASESFNTQQEMQEIWKMVQACPAVDIKDKKQEPELIQEVIYPPRQKHKISLFGKSLLYASAAMLLVMAMVLFTPVRPSVATLTDSIDAKWVEMSSGPEINDELKQGELTLAKGIAEITFFDGAVVVVEGPVSLKLESSKSLYLFSGKLSAAVSEYATGFTVNTPGATIVDLGTEFGVNVEGNTSSLHMFKGQARLIAGQKGMKKKSLTVNGNEARSVDYYTGAIKEIAVEKTGFIRQIDSGHGFVWRGMDFNLADVVGGGNGFGSGKIDFGIDVSTGNITEIDITSIHYLSSGSFTKSASVFIDGVFIPDREQQYPQISSTGLHFDECPDTTGRSVGHFLNGAWHDYVADRSSKHMLKLDGKTYTESGQAIFMHSNKGITFDLDAVRNNIFDITINKFSSRAGVSGTVSEKASGSSLTDFWVLVDGQVRFKQLDVKPDGVSFAIDIPLTDKDRFLTLVTTDAGSTNRDWALFLSPVLELELNQ